MYTQNDKLPVQPFSTLRALKSSQESCGLSLPSKKCCEVFVEEPVSWPAAIIKSSTDYNPLLVKLCTYVKPSLRKNIRINNMN